MSFDAAMRLAVRVAISAALCAAVLSGCRGAQPGPAGDSDQLTFTRDIAPLVFERCAVCHRDGELAPFPLTSYKEVKRRARQIVRVTESGFMPPWQPELGFGRFRDERRLDAAEVERLARWLQQGAAEGDPGDLPELPRRVEGWQLGEPDHVVRLEPPYLLPAEGPDTIRNFVLPLAGLGGRYVRAIEFRPGNRAVIHHANVLADANGTARRLDQRDPGPGYEGMVGAVAPGGHFLGWTPGRTPRPLEEGTAWEIAPGSDLVLQLHLFPSGKPESVQPSVGLFFTDQPPRQRPISIHLGSTAIAIPAGQTDYAVHDEWVLPVDVLALAVYPHAHYLGRELKASAELPDGTTQWLLYIKDWDFNWQDEYAFAEPLPLPRGTRLRIDYAYDNSNGNPRNPFSPPRRVVWGPLSTDEMGDLWIKVVPRDGSELDVLGLAIQDQDLRIELAGFERRLREHPDDVDALSSLGRSYVGLGEMERALEVLDRALRLTPNDAYLHHDRGLALTGLGRAEAAAAAYLTALDLLPGHAPSAGNLAGSLLQLGRLEEANAAYLAALELAPEDPALYVNLAIVETRRGSTASALAHYRQALRLEPALAEAHGNLGALLVQLGDLQSAQQHLREALRLRPRYAEAYKNLAALYAVREDLDGSIAVLEEARRFVPDDADVPYLLGMSLMQKGERAAARSAFEDSIELRPGDGRTHWDLGNLSALEGEDGAALEHYLKARELLPPDPLLYLSLAETLLRLGRRAEALEPLQEAVRLEPGNVQARELLKGLRSRSE